MNLRCKINTVGAEAFRSKIRLSSILTAVIMLIVVLLSPAPGILFSSDAGEGAEESLPRRSVRVNRAVANTLENIQDLGAGLQDSHAFVRELSVDGLKRIASAVDKAINAGLGHDDEVVRWAALVALIGDSAAEDSGMRGPGLIAKALEDEDEFIRHSAVMALSDLLKDVDRALETALSSDDWRVRQEGLMLKVGELTPAAAAYLGEAMQDDDPEFRRMAVELLGEIEPRTEYVTELLNKARRDEAFEVWVAAVEGMQPARAPLREREDIEEHLADIGVSWELALPETGWSFRKDPDEKGHIRDWFVPGYDDSEWESIEIAQAWEPGYIGAGWYRKWIELPEAPEHISAEMLFEGVDESGWVWINGEYVGGQDIGPRGWNEPFTVDVTKELRWSGGNLITVRAKNTGFAGGIWKPVTLKALQLNE